jgi:hypothetical protein
MAWQACAGDGGDGILANGLLKIVARGARQEAAI